MSNQGPSTKLVQPKTKAGKRALERKAPKLVEEPRKVLILTGHKTSQTVKDLLVDIQRMKATESVKLTGRKHDILPFETGGEVEIEGYSNKSDASLFVLGNHTKKRPDNVIMGRLYDFKLYDMMEFGIANYHGVTSFKASTIPQLGNKPAFVFVGQEFTTNKALIQAKSLFLDMFRGRQVDQINLKGLDRVVFVSYVPTLPGAGASLDEEVTPTIVFRQFAVRYKKSGTDVPRTVLEEMGPRFDMTVRRRREATLEMEREAMKQPKLTPKKQKNVKGDVLDGKVGKVYVPRQDLGSLNQGKMKGAKRERRELAAARKQKRNSRQEE
jgi:ribosome production factor 2